MIATIRHLFGNLRSTAYALPNTCGETPSSSVGNYEISLSGGVNPNYAITLNDGVLTVKPTPLTIAINDASRPFGDLNPTFSADTTGFVLDQTLTDVGNLSFASTAITPSNVGEYAIDGEFSGGLVPNYAVTIEAGTLSIMPRPVTVTARDASRTYGDANPSFGWMLSGNNPSSGTLNTLFDSTGLTLGSQASPASDAGDYAITPSGVTSANFAVTYVEGTLAIARAPLTIAVSPIAASRTYGDANPDPTAEISGLKLDHTLDDVVDSFAITTAATAGSDVGTYAVTGDGTVINANYAVTFQPGSLTVDKAPLVIAPAPATRLYGDGNPTPTLNVTGLRNGDAVDVVTAFFQSSAIPFSPVGDYSVEIQAATAANYFFADILSGTLTVQARPLTITVDDLTRFYGDPNPTLSATFAGLASFDDASVVSGLTLSTAATIDSGVQDLAIIASGASAPNYAITHVPGTLTITPAPLNFGVGEFARIYGQADPTFDATLIAGLKLDDTFADLGVSLAGPPATADVGTYDVQVTFANPNYTVASPAGVLHVDPAPLTVQVGNVARTYGETNPSLTDLSLTVNGLAFGQAAAEVLEVAFPVTATADVGNYPIIPTLLTPNYRITDLDAGNLAVLTRNIALKPENLLRYYGDENPAYTLLVAGDGLASFDTIEDVALLDTLYVDGVSVPVLPGPTRSWPPPARRGRMVTSRRTSTPSSPTSIPTRRNRPCSPQPSPTT